MLGLGWTEMLVIGVVALIFIGPKDLPVVMGRIGKVLGQIKRMGNEFQREINRTTGLDEVRNLRDSITSPLQKTAEEIRREFNTMTPTGQKPSGALKPADPKIESVVDEIRDKAGMTPPAPLKTNDQIAAEAGFKPSRPVAEPQAEPIKQGAAIETAPVAPLTKPARARKTAAVPKDAPSAPVKAAKRPKIAPDTAVDIDAAAKPVRKRTRAAAVIADEPPVAAKSRASRKKPADPAGNL